MPLKIREYNENDMGALIELVRELQAHEAQYFDRMKAPQDIDGWYIDKMVEACREHEGAILIAELEGIVAGFAALLTKVMSSGTMDEVPYVYGMVTDLAVAEQWRRTGIGTALLKECERRSREAGVNWLRINALTANVEATAAYRKFGFGDMVVKMEKPLR
jgi:GNAT superfamily N-acetyltransferase